MDSFSRHCLSLHPSSLHPSLLWVSLHAPHPLLHPIPVAVSVTVPAIAVPLCPSLRPSLCQPSPLYPPSLHLLLLRPLCSAHRLICRCVSRCRCAHRCICCCACCRRCACRHHCCKLPSLRSSLCPPSPCPPSLAQAALVALPVAATVGCAQRCPCTRRWTCEDAVPRHRNSVLMKQMPKYKKRAARIKKRAARIKKRKSGLLTSGLLTSRLLTSRLC